MKRLIFVLTILFIIALMFVGYWGFYVDYIKPFPQDDSLYFEIVFENDTVIHKPYE